MWVWVWVWYVGIVNVNWRFNTSVIEFDVRGGDCISWTDILPSYVGATTGVIASFEIHISKFHVNDQQARAYVCSISHQETVDLPLTLITVKDLPLARSWPVNLFLGGMLSNFKLCLLRLIA